MSSKKIVWFSRHAILPSQEQELKRLFGEDVKIFRDPNPFSSAEEIMHRFKWVGADEMVVVAPLSVMSRLCDLGLKPLWAEMKTCAPEDAEVEAAGRHYRFIRFRRVKRMVMEFEDV